MESETNPILSAPIQGMDVSGEFKLMAKANGFRTLGDILKYPLYELPAREKSGYRILREMLDILEENHLEEFLKD